MAGCGPSDQSTSAATSIRSGWFSGKRRNRPRRMSRSALVSPPHEHA
jgi:hypothetical protein